MKRKLFAALLALVCGATCSVLVACTDKPDDKKTEHEHDYSSSWTYDEENHFHSCTGEDCTEKADSAPHSWDNGVIKTPATCTTDGIKTYTCTVCGYHKDETVQKSGHDWVLKETVPPTCTTDGVLKYECGNAGCTEKKEEKGADKLGHDWVLKETIEPTCTADGVLKYECGHAGCTEKKEEKGADKLNLNHNWVLKETVPPTCTADGVLKYECGNAGCTEKKEEKGADKLGHDWVLKETVAPTCTTDGVLKYECGRAGCTEKKEEKGADKLGHDWVLKETVAPTCTTDGVLKYECGHAGCTEKKEEKGADKLGHNWGAWTVTEAATPEKAGVERRECSRCDASEERPVAILNTGYKITVLAADTNAPIEGAVVYLDGNDQTSVETDEHGVARFADDLTRGEYAVTVEADGYGLLDGTFTSDEYALTVKPIKKPEGQGTSASPLKISPIADGNYDYFISVGWTEDKEMSNRIVPEELAVELKNTGNSAAEFTLDLKDLLAVAGHENVPVHGMGVFGLLCPADDYYAPVSVVLEKGESYRFTLTADALGMEDSQDKSKYPANYALSVERKPAPSKGSRTSYMFNAVLGENEFTADSDWVYVKFDPAKIGKENSLYKFTFDDTVAVKNYGNNIEDIEHITGMYINSGDTLEWAYYATCLYVNAPSKTFKFNIEEVIPEGTAGNPIAVELGKDYTAQIVNADGGRIKYYKYTNDSSSDVQLTFVPDETDGVNTSVTVYKSGSLNSALVSSITGMKVWFTVPAGETYVLAVSHSLNSGTVAFLVREYDETQDVSGDTYDSPMVLTHSVEFTASFVTIRKYYKIITSTPGFYTVTVDTNGSETMDYHIANSYNYEKGKSWADIAMEATHTLYREEKEIWIVLSTTKSDGVGESEFKITYEFESLAPVEHTVTVSGADLSLEGLTVELKLNGEVVESQTTNAEGVATFSVAPNEYDVVVSGFDAEYSYNAVKTQFNLDGCNTEVVLAKPVSYSFTVVDIDGAPVSGVTVKVDVNGTVVSGETDSEGKFTTEKIVPGVYSVTVEGLSASYYFDGAVTSATEYAQDLTLGKPYNITHASNTTVVDLPEGKGTIKNASPRGGRYDYKFTATETGDYTITIVKATTTSSYRVGIKNLYFNNDNKENVIISNGTFSEEVNATCNSPVTVGTPAENTADGYESITVHLEAGQFVVMSLYTSVTNSPATVNITKG